MRHNTLCKKGLPSCSADAPKTTIDGRNWQLDGLRALSITGVLINHFWADQIWPTSNLYVVEPGYLGVRLFFVLSGYLITGILLRCRSSMEAGQSDAATNLRRFYIRRFLRIFPPYYALLALMFMANFRRNSYGLGDFRGVLDDDVPIVSESGELFFGRFHASTIPEIGATRPNMIR